MNSKKDKLTALLHEILADARDSAQHSTSVGDSRGASRNRNIARKVAEALRLLEEV